MQELSQDQWRTLITNDANAVIIDVRTDIECAQGMLEIALPMDLLEEEKFETFVREIDTTKNYYVYCRSGSRSAQACCVLEHSGVDNTYNLIGGMMSWSGPVIVPV